MNQMVNQMTKSTISQINTSDAPDRFFLHVGDFLDGFYRADNEERRWMIDEPPLVTADESRENFAFLAATAHKLANKHGLTVPEWVFDKKSYLPDPYFGSRVKGTLRLVYMYMSPTEFKHRNLFVDPEVLTRV
jgi:hypothetical protein